MQLQNMNEFSMQESSNEKYDPNTIRNLDTDFISVECLEKLGLGENPFVDHAKEQFLFMDQQIEMSINVLFDYLQNQNSTLVLLGEIGIGKTTYLRILLRKGFHHFNFCTLRAKPGASFKDIENKILERWRVPKQEGDNSRLEEYIKEYIESDKNPVLIIDDAHRLETPVLDELLQLKHRVGLQTSNVLGLVLAAEQSIQPKLNELEHKNPAATQIYQTNIRTFDTEQCKKYIDFRLQQAGATNFDLFDSNLVNKITVKSNGLPRIINELARETLNKHCQNSSQLSSSEFSTNKSSNLRFGIILAFLAGLILVVLALLNKKDEIIQLDLDTPSLEKEVIIKETIGTSIENPTIDQEQKKAEPLTNKKSGPIIHKPYVAPLVLGPSQLNEPPEAFNTIDTKKEPVKIENVKDSQMLLDLNWLLSQNPESFTIQIVASASKENLIKFSKNNFANKQTAFYQKITNNKQWFVLVYGIYPTKENALEEIKALPESIQKNKPYPIQIKSIQKSTR